MSSVDESSLFNRCDIVYYPLLQVNPHWKKLLVTLWLNINLYASNLNQPFNVSLNSMPGIKDYKDMVQTRWLDKCWLWPSLDNAITWHICQDMGYLIIFNQQSYGCIRRKHILLYNTVYYIYILCYFNMVCFKVPHILILPLSSMSLSQRPAMFFRTAWGRDKASLR